jgi:hypothetical protein
MNSENILVIVAIVTKVPLLPDLISYATSQALPSTTLINPYA